MDRNPTPPGKKSKYGPLARKPNWAGFILFAGIWIWFLHALGLLSPTRDVSIPYTTFKEQLQLDNVAEVTVDGNAISGLFARPIVLDRTPAERREAKKKEKSHISRFGTVLPSFGDEELLPLLEEQEVTVHAEGRENGWLGTLLVSLLPWVVIAGLVTFSRRKAQERMEPGAGSTGPFNIGKSKARLYGKETVSLSFADVAGLENSKTELLEVIAFLKDPKKFSALGARLPKGVLLAGPPGTGKTMLAKATAGEAHVPFFSISASEFVEIFVGVGASRVRDLFANAKKEAPAIIFIDELDAIGKARCTGVECGQEEREQTLNQILSEMDGFTPNESVVVMAATNRPDVLDPALVRPGRFDRQVQLGLPQKKARRQILEVHTRQVPLAADVDLDLVAARAIGFSGAELQNLVNEAALLAARTSKTKVEADDFDRGRDKIIMGLEREDFMNEQAKRAVACHEAGHALVARLLPGADPIRKVTIIPRGLALGATEQVPDEERLNISRSYLLDRIAVMLGGRAAERVIFNDSTTGASDDLKQTTQLIRKMVCQWGMSDKVGSVVLNTGDTHPYLRQEISEPKNFSEHTSRLVDEEIRRITSEMEEKAESLLRENRGRLDALIEALMERETLSDEEIDEIIGFEKPQPRAEGG